MRPPSHDIRGSAFRFLLAGTVIASGLAAQDIQVYSELRRLDPFGQIVPQDRGGRPAEILSPLLARNAHAAFQVVVSAPPGKHFYLFVGTYPEELLRIRVYKEIWHRQDDVWVPDRLVEIDTPYLSHIPDRFHGIPNQKYEVFFLDVFVPEDVKPGRYKLDPQVSCEGRWVIYPMEIRISDVVVPSTPKLPGRLPGSRERADASALGPLRAYLCGEPETPGEAYDSIRTFIRRNVLEDLALARAKESTLGHEAVANLLLAGLDADRTAFCSGEAPGPGASPEWYLQGRKLLYRGKRRGY